MTPRPLPINIQLCVGLYASNHFNRLIQSFRRIKGHNPYMDIVTEIREIIIAEANKYLEKHELSDVYQSIDKPKRINHDIYAGSNRTKSRDYFDIDNPFDV